MSFKLALSIPEFFFIWIWIYFKLDRLYEIAQCIAKNIFIIFFCIIILWFCQNSRCIYESRRWKLIWLFDFNIYWCLWHYLWAVQSYQVIVLADFFFWEYRYSNVIQIYFLWFNPFIVFTILNFSTVLYRIHLLQLYHNAVHY